MVMHPDCAEILIDSETIQKRCQELGREISDYYKSINSNPMVLALLKGSVPFMAELIKNMDVDLEIDFMDVSSYEGTDSTEVRILKDVESSLQGRDVLIVEDIVDTGKTLATVIDIIKTKGASSVKVVTLLNKPERREKSIEADYIGFSVPNKFVIGFGLDYNQKYRNLPYIGVIKPEAI